MKTVILLACCMFIGGAVWAQVPPREAGPGPEPNPRQNVMDTPPAMPHDEGTSVSLDLTRIQVTEALRTLFQNQGKSFVLAPDVSGTVVDMHVKNVPFETALRALLRSVSPPLTYRKDRDTYFISSLRGASDRPGDSGPDWNTAPMEADGVTMRIPAMSVKDAVAEIAPKWGFKEGLCDLPMPGASFYKFPRDMAIGMVLIAAGLVPPRSGVYEVSARGKADLQSLYQWIPPKSPAPTSGMGGFGGGYGGSYGSSGYGTSQQPAEEQAISIGAYKTKDGKWLFTVLSSQAVDYELLQMLFSVSGKSYVMGDLSNRPYYLTTTIPTGKGQPIQNKQLMSGAPWKLSVQVYDATLEQVLDSITSAAGLKYRKTGPTTDPTYVVDTPAPTDGPGGSSAPSTGKKVGAVIRSGPVPSGNSGSSSSGGPGSSGGFGIRRSGF